MSVLDPWAPTDPLGEALHFLRMDGAFYCRSVLTAPWGLTLPPMPGYIWFHVVTSGLVMLESGESETCTLGHSELALVPHGAGHVLRSAAGVPAPGILDLDREVVSDRYEVLTHGGGGAPAELICGAVRFHHPSAGNLVASLPDLIHVRLGGELDADATHGLLRLMAAEAQMRRPGGEAIITRLGDIVVVQAIRSWIESAPAARTGWLGALRDPEIGRAISAIHRDPSRPWTLTALAEEVAMSRSSFAARFSMLVGEPAMAYLARWRMHLAADALSEQGASVGELAHRFGYRSEAAFSRAFKRVMGTSPGALRASRAAASANPSLA